MTDGPQHPDEHPDAGEEFAPKPGQPTLPFRAVSPPPGHDQPQQGGGYGFPQQPAQPQQQGGYGFPQQPAQPQQGGGYGFPQQPAQPQQGGYGFPQQPAQPQQGGGYGFPQQPQQGGPEAGGGSAAWSPPAEPIGQSRGGAGGPDWAALADANSEGGKRRKVYVIGGAVLAVLVVGAVVTAAVVSGGDPKPGPTAAPTTTALPTPSPTFSDVTPTAPPSPTTVLADPKLDKAPLTASGLFAGSTVHFPADKSAKLPARGYSRTNVYGTTACTTGGGGGMPALLAREGCQKMLRATYRRGSTAVTVGVAVFSSASRATAVMSGMNQQDYLQPLAGGGIGHSFCHSTRCQSTIRTIGRYAYITISGRVDGTPVTPSDPNALSAAQDVSSLTFRLLYARGNAEATAP